MNSNTLGTAYSLTTFGESHGLAIGGVIDGCPAGILLDKSLIESELAKRKPGFGAAVSARKEPDEVEFLSGLFEGQTTGQPIAFLIRNRDAKSSDYDNIKNVYEKIPGKDIDPQLYKDISVKITAMRNELIDPKSDL